MRCRHHCSVWRDGDGGAPPEWLQALQEVAEASAADEQRIFGESLPAGLRLILSRR